MKRRGGRVSLARFEHCFGLFHTFEGIPHGCDGIGDHVGDTVAHRNPNFGTPTVGERHNACDSNEDAPVQNFMNYTDDAWMTHFTERQGGRMREMVGTFRPDLLQGNTDEVGEVTRVALV